MCGICGFWDWSGPPGRDDPADTAATMALRLRHRGPDDHGVWVDDHAGLALAHRRLSIVDLTCEGHQPMSSPSGRFVATFNGEIYNFAVLRRELEGRGYAFRGHSDTEVLVAAVDAWGVPGAVRRFVGMFAFALWDRSERVLHLARDRMGEKPLYYGWQGGVLLFGSELKALRAHPSWQGEVDRDALALFFRRNTVPAPHSIYRGIFKLPPGTIVTFRRQGDALPEPEPYWSLDVLVENGRGTGFRGSPEEAVDALEALLGDAVEQQMVADVPLGAFLSGGVDSSAIVALMQARAAAPVRTFSIGFHEASHDEARYAREVAAHLGTRHTELIVTAAEARDVIPRLPQVYDEPFADSSQIPTCLVAQLARRDVTVSLSGDGGDELFGGYTRYADAERLWRALGRVPGPLARAAAHGLAAIPPAAWDRAGALPFLAPLVRRDALSEPVGKLARLLASRDAEAVYSAFMDYWPDSTTLVYGANHIPASPATQLEDGLTAWMMARDITGYLPDDILVKVDRAAMAVGLETRVPLLDHRVVELAWSLPHHYKVRDGRSKWVLREVLYRHVPRELIERPKQGFGVPVGEWLRGPLRPWAEELLSESRIRREGFLDPVPVRRRWSQHLARTSNWEYSLWGVLMFQSWLEAMSHEATWAAA